MIDVYKISSKNLLKNGLVKPTSKLIKSITMTSYKIQKSKIYDEAINDLIHENSWYKIIYKKL